MLFHTNVSPDYFSLKCVFTLSTKLVCPGIMNCTVRSVWPVTLTRYTEWLTPRGFRRMSHRIPVFIFKSRACVSLSAVWSVRTVMYNLTCQNPTMYPPFYWVWIWGDITFHWRYLFKHVIGAFIYPTTSLYKVVNNKALTAAPTVCEKAFFFFFLWTLTIYWTRFLKLTVPACFSSAIPADWNAHIQLRRCSSLFLRSPSYQGPSGSFPPFSIAKVPMYYSDTRTHCSVTSVRCFYFTLFYACYRHCVHT